MIYAMSTFSESFSSPFNKLTQSYYKNFQEIGNELTPNVFHYNAGL